MKQITKIIIFGCEYIGFLGSLILWAVKGNLIYMLMTCIFALSGGLIFKDI